jgi:hypothetical protein
MSNQTTNRLAVLTLLVMAWSLGVDMARAHHNGSHRATATQLQAHNGHCQ